VFSPIEAHAQNFLKRITDRAKDAVDERIRQTERKVDETIERKINEAIDQATEATKPGTKSDPSGMSTMGGFAGFGGNLITESSYRFDTRLGYTIQIDGKQNNRREIHYELLYNEGGDYTGTKITEAKHKQKAEDMLVIYDGKNQCMVMVQDSPNEKFAMTVPWAFDAASLQEQGGAPVSASMDPEAMGRGFERIGTKTVAGFKCLGYRFSDETTRADIWMCDEFSPELHRIFERTRSGNSLLNTFMPAVLPTGMLLEIRTENRQSGESMLMTFTGAASDRPLVINMSDYSRAP
jgi:alpha-glucosidase (family GH31 glycosyl hydrolase)